MKKKPTKKALGKGIRALLENIPSDVPVEGAVSATQLLNTVAQIPVDKIEVNPFQPRTTFDQEKLEELASSIKVHGVVQPITVRVLTKNQYQLISGERRLRASKLAGLKEIPAYVRSANDQEMLEIALIENIQREDLNAIEVALNYQRLIEECDLTHELMADRIGKNRATITNYLRLLKLPPEVQLALKERKLSMGHARAILGAEDISIQLLVFKETLEKGLSVRKVEQLVRAYLNPKQKSNGKVAKLPAAYQDIQDDLCEQLDTKVSLKRKGSGQGEIVIPFQSDSDLNRILELLQ